MNVETEKMSHYAEFLSDNSLKIKELCSRIQESLTLAVQCMDQQSGRAAAARLSQNLENIKKNVPISDDASRRLVLSRKYIDSAGSVFGR